MTVSASKAIRFALTGAIAATLLAGASGGSAAPSQARSAQQAQDALSKGKVDRAIMIAERAVAESPREAALRAVLAQAYLKAGRFEAAATTFEDAIELGDQSPRSVLGLALAHAACGRDQDAVAILDEHRAGIPAEDLGLALALAGETGRGAAVLTDALRASEGSPKLRQNLAYAYALDGRWAEARLMVAQDLPADQVDARITEWAMQGKPDDYQKRVAALLGAPMVTDPGQPQHLALGEAAPAQVAEAPVATPAEQPTVTAAAVPAEAPAPAPVVAAPVVASSVPASVPAENFDIAFARPSFVSQPVIQPVPARAAPVSRDVARLAPAARVKAAPRPVVEGSHRVQLGAFSSAEGASRAVNIFASRNPALRGRLTVTPAVVNGKNYWRVAAIGFDAGSARYMCSSLKARGGACLAYAAPPRGAGGRMALARR